MSPVTAIWTRILAPADPSLSPEIAKHFLSLQFTDEEKARYEALASREQFDLTRDELAELDAFVHVNTVIMLLQSKARLSLKQRQPAA